MKFFFRLLKDTILSICILFCFTLSVTVNRNIITSFSLGFTASSLLGDIPSSFHLTGREYYKCSRLPEWTGEVVWFCLVGFAASYFAVAVKIQGIVIHWKLLTFKLTMYWICWFTWVSRDLKYCLECYTSDIFLCAARKKWCNLKMIYSWMVRLVQRSNFIFSVVHLMYNSRSRLKSLGVDTLPFSKIVYIPKVHFLKVSAVCRIS